MSAWLRAQLMLAAVMGTLAGVGLGLLHVPYFYVVALVAAAGETIPVLGPVIAGVTAVAIAMSVSTRLAVTVGVFFVRSISSKPTSSCRKSWSGASASAPSPSWWRSLFGRDVGS